MMISNTHKILVFFVTDDQLQNMVMSRLHVIDVIRFLFCTVTLNNHSHSLITNK